MHAKFSKSIHLDSHMQTGWFTVSFPGSIKCNCFFFNCFRKAHTKQEPLDSVELIDISGSDESDALTRVSKCSSMC